jgi:hypothetical protein
MRASSIVSDGAIVGDDEGGRRYRCGGVAVQAPWAENCRSCKCLPARKPRIYAIRLVLRVNGAPSARAATPSAPGTDDVDHATKGQRANAHDTLAAIVATDGSADHPHVARLLARDAATRDLADAVHALCKVYGGHPGLIDAAHDHCAQPEACDWLLLAGKGFAIERSTLIRIAAAVGPLPSTPGQAATETALAGIRHTVAMLARSDRGGCATGAAGALVTEWTTIRDIVGRAAATCGITLPPTALPAAGVTAVAIAMLGESPAVERAMAFGARQLLVQHRGLWDLLAARAVARNRS